MIWEGHILPMVKEDVRTGFWCRDLMERIHFEDLRTDERIILKRVFKNWYGGMDWIDLV